MVAGVSPESSDSEYSGGKRATKNPDSGGVAEEEPFNRGLPVAYKKFNQLALALEIDRQQTNIITKLATTGVCLSNLDHRIYGDCP